jgi:signal transduction histidine kinase
MLDDLGLLPTLRWLLDRTAQRSGVKCTMQAEIRGEKIAPEIAVTCYRVVQQALTNVGRHAKAKSVEVSIRREDHRLSVQIADDGIGFDVRGARKRALLGESLGLLSMEERVGLLGGKFEIRSSKGKGTVVRAEFPM